MITSIIPFKNNSGYESLGGVFLRTTTSKLHLLNIVHLLRVTDIKSGAMNPYSKASSELYIWNNVVS